MPPKTILLVERAAEPRAAHADRLRFVGFRVVEAEDVEEGISRARGSGPDLVILEAADSGGATADALRRLRQGTGRAFVPAIVLAAEGWSREDLDTVQFCTVLSGAVSAVQLVRASERCIGTVDEGLAPG